MTAAVAFDRVTLVLGGRAILHDVTIGIEAGEFIGVLGPNGAGKTTLMRAILGLVRPVSGAIRVFGADPERGNPAIGYLPQLHRPESGQHLSGWDFVACAWRGHRPGLPRLDADGIRAVTEALDRVGAAHFAHKPLGELSGGERQRLLLAQSILGRPRLLLLDEPLISLDPRRQAQTVQLVRELGRELNAAVLFTAHEINPLLGAIDRVLYLGNRQAALGPVDEVIAGPVLSRLYGAEIEVVRVGGRIFVMSGSQDLEHAEHRHDDHAHL